MLARTCATAAAAEGSTITVLNETLPPPPPPPPPLQHSLVHKWDFFFHLCSETSWDIHSYKVVFKDANYAEEILFVVDLLHENILKKCMVFVMRAGITPQWEDPKNRNGGCFSFKIHFKGVYTVWRNILLAACGQHLFVDDAHHRKLNGVTISPKKNFCIVKIWMCDCVLQDPTIFSPIENLNLTGCIFKKHEPEY